MKLYCLIRKNGMVLEMVKDNMKMIPMFKEQIDAVDYIASHKIRDVIIKETLTDIEEEQR